NGLPSFKPTAKIVLHKERHSFLEIRLGKHAARCEQRGDGISADPDVGVPARDGVQQILYSPFHELDADVEIGGQQVRELQIHADQLLPRVAKDVWQAREGADDAE